MRKLIIFFILSTQIAWAQNHYSVANAHSHNDYEQENPFSLAYSAGFGSIEADVFLRNDSLFVSHEYKHIHPQRDLESLYLNPILEILNKNEGRIYPDYQLQLLIDLKTDYKTTLPVLEKLLTPMSKYLYPGTGLVIVVSGSMPPPEEFDNYADFIYFDGRPDIEYSESELKRIALISENAWKYSLWNKEGLPVQPEKITEVVNRVHALNKPIRLWATPDKEKTWEFLKAIKVDYLNTDKILELAKYLNI